MGKYIIEALNTLSNEWEILTGTMPLQVAKEWQPIDSQKARYHEFRVTPFKINNP